ncbi:hypothetical protein [Burkholderia glumae]|uniref:hypothetical protein n=1 Tax=Burkholderia glumae TaxID=337 RepID=UPI002036E0EF|nr:hypothetical protein [Burkholderia glumae]MCM2550476.1 hypothetical protein [Burkholderia glumae]
MADTPIYDGVERRLRAGDQRFKQIQARIDASDEQVRAHLSEQDRKIDAIAAAVCKIETNTQPGMTVTVVGAGAAAGGGGGGAMPAPAAPTASLPPEPAAAAPSASAT